MDILIQFYKDQITSFTTKRESLNKKIHWLGTVRLLLFVGTLTTLWFGRESDWTVIASILFVFAVSFTVLMFYHKKLFYQKEYAEAMIQLNTNELKGIDYDFSAFDGSAEAADSNHSFSLDLDIFGNQSIFQSINRTVTLPGNKCLIDWFYQPLDNKQAILDRQQAVRELAAKTYFRQHFYVIGETGNNDIEGVKRLYAVVAQTTRFSQSLLRKINIWIVPLLWIVVISGCVAGVFPFSMIGIMFAFAFLFANIDSRHIHKVHKSAEKIEQTLLTYAQLIKLIETESFDSELLKSNQNQLETNGKRASKAISTLSKITGALDQRYSLGGFIFNLFYLRDTRVAMQLEQWMAKYEKEFKRWFEALACVDAMCSLGGFAFNHPGYMYPNIADHYFEIKGKALEIGRAHV